MGFKRYFLSWLFWLISSFLLLALGWIGGGGVGYFCENMGWIKYSDDMFSHLNFLWFLFIGGILGLLVFHILRALIWLRLHRRLTREQPEWTKRKSLKIVLIDEILWLFSFLGIWLLLLYFL